MRNARAFITVDASTMTVAQRATTHAEIEERYKAAHKKALKKRGKPPIGLLRVRELEKIIDDRWAGCIPDTPDAVDAVAVLACHCAAIGAVARFHGFVRAHARWMSPGKINAVIERESANMPGDADGLAWRLKLTAADRKRLRIRTIGELGISRQQRARRRNNAAATRSAKNRLAAGASPRAQSLARTRPWETFGWSRRKWYRQGKPLPDSKAGDTNSFAVPSIIAANETVSNPVLDSPRQAHPEGTQKAVGSGPEACSVSRSAPTEPCRARRPPPPNLLDFSEFGAAINGWQAEWQAAQQELRRAAHAERVQRQAEWAAHWVNGEHRRSA